LNDGAVVSGENGTQRREGKRETKGKGRGWVGRSRIQHEFKGGGTWMTSTSESLPLCARYIWMCVYARMRVRACMHYTHLKKKHVRCAPRARLADWGG